MLSKKCMCWCFIHYWIEKCTVKQWNLISYVSYNVLPWPVRINSWGAAFFQSLLTSLSNHVTASSPATIAVQCCHIFQFNHDFQPFSLWGVHATILYSFICSYVCVTCPAHFNQYDLITQITFGEECNVMKLHNIL